MNFLLLKAEEIEEIMSMQEAIASVSKALRWYSKGQGQIPPRIKLHLEEHRGKSLYMPGYVKEVDALGIKVVSVYPDNRQRGITNLPSTMMLSDPVTGQLLCIMDGVFLTELRTGAISGVATELLANPRAENFLLIGTGGQAESQLQAVLAVRPIKRVRVAGLDVQRAEAFVQRMKEKKVVSDRVDMAVSQNLNRDVAQAHIITTATTAAEPVFDGNYLQPGTHINGVGSYTPYLSEIPPEVLEKAGKIYVDTKDAIKESGDFRKPIDRGCFREEQITGELGRLIEGKIKGRENEEEITFLETTGNAVFDLVVGREIYEQALKMGVGTRACL